MEDNYFTILWWFLSYISVNQPQVYMCPPHPEPLSHHPPHSISLGCPRAPALGARRHASNLYWSSVLHMIMYMFQCCSLRSSHPRLLPQSPKVCSLHLCPFCCLTHRVIVTIFLNGIEFLILTSVATCGSWLLGWTLWVWQSSEEQSFMASDGRSQTQTWAWGPCWFPRGQLRVCLLSQLSVY